MGVRHLSKSMDQLILAWFITSNMLLHILLNKADKLSKLQVYSDLILPQFFSALKKQSIPTCHAFLLKSIQGNFFCGAY